MTNNSPVGNDLRIRIVKRPFPKECESCVKSNYYTASYMSMQYETNPALWLATCVGKMVPSCQLGITRYAPQENSILHMTNLLLTKLVIFFRVYKTSTLSHSLNTRKTTWPISWLHGWSVTENKKWIVRHLAIVFYSITLVLFQKIT